MTALRREAIAMVEAVPEESLPIVINTIKKLQLPSADEEKRRKEEAYLSLRRIIRPIPGLDEKKELAEYREERYGG